jgi:hypothetical protein
MILGMNAPTTMAMDIKSLPNAQAMASADEKTPPKETTL